MPPHLLKGNDKQFVNFHGAKLPYYRGPANYFWVLINGEQETQATLHHVSERLDAGPIIGFGPIVKIKKFETVFNIYFQILKSGFPLLSNYWQSVKDEENKLVVFQDENEAVLRSFPSSKDVKLLKKNGHHIFSFHDLIVHARASAKEFRRF